MLRDMQNILGLPALKHESERWKIDNGNAALKCCAKVGHWCLATMTPFVIEIPWTSLLWEAPQMLHLRRRKGVRMARAGFCQFGLPWRKATGLLCSFGIIAHVDRRCKGCKGICSKSLKPHQQLAGIEQISGKCWTHLAEPYPRGLCTAMVKMMCEARLQIQHLNLGQLLHF